MIGEVRCVWVRHFVNYGSTYFRHWCAKRENCTGLLLQKGAHDIDVIHWLAGGYAKRVVGMGGLSVYNRTADRLKNGEVPDRKASWSDDCWPPLEVTKLAPEIDIEDHNMLLMQLDNGVQASYEECFFTPDGTRNYTFIGTKGRLENFGIAGDCRICVWTKRRPGISEADLTYRLYDDSSASGGHGATTSPPEQELGSPGAPRTMLLTSPTLSTELAPHEARGGVLGSGVYTMWPTTY